MKDEILKIQQRIEMKEAARDLEGYYRTEEAQELMNVPLGKLKFDSKMTKENYEKELLDFYYTFNDEPPTPKIFDEIGKVAERLFTNVRKHEGIAHELRVIPQGELNVCEQCKECFISTLTSTFDKPRYACMVHGKFFDDLLGDTTLTIYNFGCNKFVSKHSEPQTV